MSNYSPVTVNLNVTVDTSGLVQIFNEDADIVANAVVCERRLLASDISGVIEFQQLSSSPEDISGQKRVDWANETSIDSLAVDHFHYVMNGPMDASAASPFTPNYLTSSAYYSFGSLGELVLANYAHQLFGHVAATAAISNDTTLINQVNGKNLGELLKTALSNLSAANATTIARKVIGQDAARARDQDNNPYAPDVLQSLMFRPEDVIFVTVNVKGPTISAGKDQGYLAKNGSLNSLNDTQFVMRITLKA